MPTQSKLAIYKMLPTKFTKKIQLELQRTFVVLVSLLRTHRRRAFLLSLGPSTILKFVTVMLPIIKLLPPTIKAIRTLSYFTKSNGNNNSGAGSNSSNTHARMHGAGGAVGSDGITMSMDELSEILWTPAEESYWERVHAMVTRHGWYKTMGVSLAGVRPGRVEVVMPFRAEVSGEGGTFHASLIPTLIVLTGQLTGTTLLPRHFALQPIDLKCNILSACDASTFLLIARGAAVVRGDHSITVKVEILKASGQVPGSTQVVTPSSRPPLLSWSSWVGSSTTPTATASSSTLGASAMNLLVPGTGIERNKLVLCATGTQTSVIIRADTDLNNEEEKEITRLRREREESRTRGSFSSTTSSSASTVPSSASTVPSSSVGAAAASLGIVGFGSGSESTAMEESIILGDSFQLSALSSRHSPSPGPSSPSSPREHSRQQYSSLSDSFFEVESPKSKESNTTTVSTAATKTSSSHSIAHSMSYASAVRYGTDQDHDHQYDETSDTEAWRK